MVTTQYDYITCKHIHHINNRTFRNPTLLSHFNNIPISTTTGLLYFLWVVSEETVEHRASTWNNQTAGHNLIKLTIDLGVASNMIAAHHMKGTRVVNNIHVKQLWLSYTFLPRLLDFYGYPVTMVAGFPWVPCYNGCWISAVTLLLWLLVFHGYPVTMLAGFPRLPCYHGGWFSMVTVLPWLLLFHGYSVAMVAI
jgi:hypothetical protein